MVIHLQNLLKTLANLKPIPKKTKLKAKLKFLTFLMFQKKASIYHQMISELYSKKITHAGIQIAHTDIYLHLFQYSTVKKPFPKKQLEVKLNFQICYWLMKIYLKKKRNC